MYVILESVVGTNAIPLINTLAGRFLSNVGLLTHFLTTSTTGFGLWT